MWTGSRITTSAWNRFRCFRKSSLGEFAPRFLLKRLAEANAKIGISDSAAQLIGPGLAGALIQWLTAPFAILLDAFSFFLSAWILRGIPPGASDAPKMRGRSIGAEIREGLAEIWHNATLRSLAWSIAVWQLFRHAYFAIVVLFAARELGFSPGRVGVLWMLAGAIG